MTDDDDDGFIKVVSKQQWSQQKQRLKSFTGDTISQRNRPIDALLEIQVESLDEHVVVDTIESPLFWSKLALVGDCSKFVDELLHKFAIFPVRRIDNLWTILFSQFGIFPESVKENFEEFVNTYCFENRQRFKFLSIIPEAKPIEYGKRGRFYYFIHIRFEMFLLAGTEPKQYDSNFIEPYNVYRGFLGEKATHVPVTEDDKFEKNKENFLEIMKCVEGKQHDADSDNENGEKENRKKDKRPYYTDLSDEELSKLDNTFTCKLNLEDSYSGYGVITDDKYYDKKIFLYNRKNCFRAFNGDVVLISVFNKNSLDSSKSLDDKSCSGRVVSVKTSHIKPVNKIFLCRVQSGMTNCMKPICNTIPIIKVDNKFAHDEISKFHDRLKDLKIINGYDYLIRNQIRKLDADDFADKHFVTVKCLDENLRTSVDGILCIDSFNCDIIFIVIYRTWSNHYQFPYGEVIGLFSPDGSFAKSLGLIMVSCEVPLISHDDETVLNDEIKEIKRIKYVKSSNNKSLPVNTNKFIFVFKYDNRLYHEIAYSTEKLNLETVRIGVHIVNVSAFISKNSYLDKQALKQFFTFAFPNVSNSDIRNEEPLYLLSKAVTKNFLSLSKTEEIDVISFYFEVNLSTFQIVNNENYSSYLSERVRLNEELDPSRSDELIRGNYKDLFVLYRFCERRFHSRKPDRYPLEWLNLDFTLKASKTVLIIMDELDHLVNSNIETILMQLTQIFPVIVKEFIYNEPLVQNWLSEIDCRLTQSLMAKKKEIGNHSNGTMRDRNISNQGLRVTEEFLKNCLTNSVNLFKMDQLLPDIGFQMKKYFDRVHLNFLHPFNLATQTGKYKVCATKPLSCYLDIITQRLLMSSLMAEESGTFNDDDLFRIADVFDNQKFVFQNYSKRCKSYEIRHLFDSKSFILDCILNKFDDETLFLFHPLLMDVNYDDRIRLENLELNNVESPTKPYDENIIRLTWKTKIFDYEEKEERNLIPSNKMVMKELYVDSMDWSPSVRSSEISLGDREKLKELSRNISEKYHELTSEVSENVEPTIYIKCALKERDILRVQFNYDYSDGVMKINPELLVVNPHFRLCLCHRNDPFKFFMHPNDFRKINFDRFTNLTQYKYQFRLLNRLEGIYQTITTASSYIIHNVQIDWVGYENEKSDIYGLLVLDRCWCQTRFIKLVHMRTPIKDRFNALRTATETDSMDYLICLQSYIAERNAYWIGHCRVADICLLKSERKDKTIKNTDLPILMVMKLVHSNFPINHSKDFKYTMEFLEVPISSRIFDRSIRKLKSDSPAEAIVMRNISSKLSDAQDFPKEYFNVIIERFLLNQSQQAAVRIALRDSISLIWGPPGTGKTMVGCIIAAVFVHMNRKRQNNPVVMYCGPSNTSVDVVAEKMMDMFGNDCPKLLRIYSGDIMNADFPHPCAKINREGLKTPEKIKSIALHFIVRMKGKPYAEQFKIFENYFQQNTSRKNVSRSEFSIALLKYESLCKQAYHKEIKDGNYEVILCTAATSCKKIMTSFFITQTIIDEAGMCSEPESLGPFVDKVSLENIVLIGDHKQLRPIVTCTTARIKQLNLSLFERLYDGKKCCTMLNLQYRMHPSICEFPSECFYSKNSDSKIVGKLKTALCDRWSGIPDEIILDKAFNGLQYFGLHGSYMTYLKKNHILVADEIWYGSRTTNFKCYDRNIDTSLLKKYPVMEKILFIQTCGSEVTQSIRSESGNTKSKGNPLEVEAVEILYRKLLSKFPNKSTGSKSILVMTQYRLQEHFLKRKCSEILKSLNVDKEPNISTVIRSQGSECDYVIFSTVRSLPDKRDIDPNPSPGWTSKYLGFITDVNQLNVALTRAKKGLFILGNSHLLSVNKTWNALIKDLKKRECYVENICRLE